MHHGLLTGLKSLEQEKRGGSRESEKSGEGGEQTPLGSGAEEDPGSSSSLHREGKRFNSGPDMRTILFPQIHHMAFCEQGVPRNSELDLSQE